MNALTPIMIDAVIEAREAEANEIAKNILELDRGIKKDQDMLSDLKGSLIEYGSGITYQLADGKVQVTQPGKGGPTGKFFYKFDETIFLSLPAEQQEQIKALGVVSLEAEVKKPFPATVKCFK